MSSTAKFDTRMRETILSTPEAILEDPDMMEALVAANERAMGTNVVDLRGIAMDRLEHRLDRLEDTHRSVIAAAYDNLAGANMVHRAILKMLDPVDFESFLHNLAGPVADALRVDALRLVLESETDAPDAALERLGDVLGVAAPGFIDRYLAAGPDGPVRQVTLRPCEGGNAAVYGDAAPDIRSEACLRLDFGPDRLPGLLALGAGDPDHFTSGQGTDLMAFLAGVFERVMRRWLS